MKYINTKTGAVINSPCKISGGDWVEGGKETPNVAPEVNEEQTTQPNQEEAPTGNDDIDGVTKAQIMQELDSQGVEYDKKAKKVDLYKLMLGE